MQKLSNYARKKYCVKFALHYQVNKVLSNFIDIVKILKT